MVQIAKKMCFHEVAELKATLCLKQTRQFRERCFSKIILAYLPTTRSPAQWRETQTLAGEAGNVKMKLRFLNLWAHLGLELVACSTPKKWEVVCRVRTYGFSFWRVSGFFGQ